MIRSSIVPILAGLAAPALGGTQGELQKLLPNDGAPGDEFGTSVGISGTTAIVGAPFHRVGEDPQAGAAYLFDTTTGGQTWKLTANDADQGELFGFSVAIDGNTAIVGAYLDDVAGLGSGSAYLFDVTTGLQLAKLVPNDPNADDVFGIAVDISGGLAIVGAPRNDDNGIQSGSAYVFDGGAQTAKLLPTNGADWHLFGSSVAISGTTAVVGAYLSGTGRAYLFNATTGVQTAELLPGNGVNGDWFGYSVAIDGATVVVGAPAHDTYVGVQGGSAYVYDTAGQFVAELRAADAANLDSLGDAVGVSGDTALAGAFFDFEGVGRTGSAYLFDATTGLELTKLLASDGGGDDELGDSVAIDGSTVVTGAPEDDDNGMQSGSAYVFSAAGPFHVSFCDASDGALAACPCGNTGNPDSGCNNAQSTGGVRATVTSFDTTTLQATITGTDFAPAGSPTAIVIRGNDREATPQVFFDGVRCVGLAGFARLAGTNASAGTSTHTFGHGAGPGTYYYQVWYRNTPAGYCVATAAANVSNGTTITW